MQGQSMYITHRFIPFFIAVCASLLLLESALAQQWPEPVALSVNSSSQNYDRSAPKGIGVGTLGLSSTVTPLIVDSEGTASLTLMIDLSGDPNGEPNFFLDGDIIVNGGQSSDIFVDFEPSSQTPVDSFDGSNWNCMQGKVGGFFCSPFSGVLAEGLHQITLTFDVFSEGAEGGPVEILTDTNNFSGVSASSTFVVTGVGNAPLSFTSEFSNTTPGPEDPVDLTATITNTSTINRSEDFVVEFESTSPDYDLPSSFSDSNFSCSPTTDGLSCNSIIGGLSPGQQITLTLPTTAPNGAAPFSASVMVSPFGTDSVISANPQTVNGDTGAELIESVSVNTPDPVVAGENLVYTATVTNTMGAPGRNVFFALDLFDDQGSGTGTYVSGIGTNWVCAPASSARKSRPGQKGPISQLGVGCDYGPDLPVGQTTPPVTLTFTAPTADGVTFIDALPFTAASNQSFFSSPSPITINVVPSVDLSLAKTAQVSTAAVGNQFDYSLTVTNDGPGSVDRSFITVTDVLPPEVSFVSFDSPLYTCTDMGGGTIVCNYTGSPTLLGDNESDTISLTVEAVGPGTAINTADVADSSGAVDPDLTNNTDGVSVDIAGSADLSLTKTASVTTIGTGGQFTYTLTVDNAGPNAPSIFSITDTLPTQVSFDSFAGTDFTCIESTGTVTCDYAGPPLAIGVSTSVDLTVTANTDGTADNTASVALSGADVDPVPGNNSDNASVIVTVPTSDLSLTKTASVTTIGTGAQFTYTLAVNNDGPDAPSGFTITDTLPGQVSFDSFTGADFSCIESTGTVTCDYAGPPLAVGAAASVDLTVTANTDGTANNSATVALNGADVDPLLSNNSDTASVTITLPTADLSIAKTASVSVVDVGGSFNYTLAVSNAGPDMASAFTVSDTLPGEVSFDSASGADFSCTESAGVVSCDYVGPGLASGANTSVDLNVTAQSDGVVSNTANVALTAPAVDPGTANNSASIDVTINPQADLSLAKTVSASAVNVGDVFDWLITVTNNGPADADGFSVSDTLPTGTSFNALVAPDFTCTSAGADISCAWTGPSPLVSGSSSQITVTVNADSPGTANNTASVTAAAGAPDTNLANNTASASAVINALPMTTIITSVVDTPDPVEPGGTFTLAATLNNQGPEVANNLFAVFTLGAGVTFDGATAVKGGGGWSCSFISGGSNKSRRKGGSSGGSFVDCFNPGPLPVSATTTVSIDLIAPESPGIINTGIEVGSDEFGPDIQTETTTVGADVDLSVRKLASTDSVEIGEDFQYTISVSNALGTADNISVADAISPMLLVSSINGQNWACSEFQNNFQCLYSGAPLGAGDTTSVLTFNVRAMSAGEVSNTARVSSDQNDINPGDNSSTVLVNVGGVNTVDLVLGKSSLPETVVVGQQYQYAFTVENRGLSQASGVVISDQLPAGVQFISGGSVGWSCSNSGGLVQCARDGVILPDSSVDTVTLNVRAPMTIGVLQNTAEVRSNEQETNPDDNRAAATTSVVSAGPDVAVVKVVDQTTARRNDLLTYNIDVSNLSSETATGVMITDVLPTGLTVVDVIAPNWDCQVTTAQVLCSLLSDLDGGANASLMLTGRVTVSSGVISNRVTVTTSSADPITDNNASEVDTTVTGDPLPANLTISIDDTVDPVLAEESFDYLITYSNEGPGTATDFVITGEIPVGLTVGPIAGPDELSCAVEGIRLVCRSQSNLAANEERLITVSVTAPPEAGELSFPVEIQFDGLGIDENGTDNTDVEQTTVRLTPTADELEDQLTSALGDIDDPMVSNNLAPTAELCANPPPGVLDLCQAIADALDDGRSAEVAEAIRQIVGAPAATQHTSLIEAGSTQFNNLFNRFNQNRQNRGAANGGTVNIDGLAFRYGNEVLPLSYMQAGGSDEPVIDSSGLIKPWAFFINGTISGGDKDPTTREVAFDFDTRGITMGVDYRFSSKFIGGAALGYSDFDSDIQGGGTLESDGVMLHLFGNYYPTDRLFVDGLLSFGSLDFDQRRPIAFNIGDLVVDELATGSTEADMLSGSLSVGYNYNSGSWNFTPSGSISIVDAEIDAFDETGTSLGLNYAEQDVESLIFSANLSVSKIISLSKGILTPTFDVSYLHESQNDDNNLSTQILGGPVGASFMVEADNPDRNYASAGLGLVYVGANGRQAFLSYRNILGLSGFSRWTVNAGVRFEF